ncbi:hypothetical protein ACNARK_07435 [Proteus sp. DFP240708]|uniref:Prevent-host-death protein n=3 Tax=Proteus TaxID=583 RepID=A0A6I7DCM9_9GAMM|nr:MULTISPECIES: hypothetical protein [Proteus]MBG2710112.1 hypothetical protein [Proteus mirabilis]MBG2766624.1 hypothetical protein [Proteus mirabilis]MBG2802936.1 hypothetical protein [Proteus mirabilis]MBG3019199.1 hypothetical protein [Proteus mirabilis]MBG3081811.1 hypothetical protein [Proteus mirabilis]
MSITMSQKLAREGLGNPELFQGGVYITKNGQAELFVQTAEERQLELQEREKERQSNALLKLVMIAKEDIANEQVMSPEDVKRKLRGSRT